MKDLAAIYHEVPRAWQIIARDRILPAYAAALDAANRRADSLTLDDVPSLEAQLNAGESVAGNLILQLTPALRDWTVRVESTHRAQFVAASKTAANVNLGSVLTAGDAKQTLSATVSRNVSLVRSVSDDIRKSIAESAFKAFTSRSPIRDLAKEINDATSLGVGRSLRIARDQTTKLASTLDRERQQEIGITQFIWIHSGKLHFRPEHKARDGKIYDWEKNNLDGDLPGVAINCGCKAQAYIDLGVDAGAGADTVAVPEYFNLF